MRRELTHKDWVVETTMKFGKDPMKWRFVCPSCGHVASVQDWKDAGATQGAVAFSCVGRWAQGEAKESFGKEGGPCNYAGGGLIGLNPVRILHENGESADVFEFAEQTDDKTRADRKTEEVRPEPTGEAGV